MKQVEVSRKQKHDTKRRMSRVVNKRELGG